MKMSMMPTFDWPACIGPEEVLYSKLRTYLELLLSSGFGQKFQNMTTCQKWHGNRDSGYFSNMTTMTVWFFDITTNRYWIPKMLTSL